MAIHDHHALESSATVTPAHARCEPLQGTIIPHSSREAAGMKEVREADDASSTSAHPSSQHMKKIPLLTKYETIFDKGTSEKRTPTVQTVPTESTLIYAPSISEQPEVEEMTEVSTMDVPLHQTVRAMTPVFTVAIYRFIFHGVYGTDTYISLAPVILGVMLASYGDLNATVLGFVMTMLGTILAAVKTVTTNRLQTAGLHLGALELLYRMSPIACMQSLAVAYICGEFDGFDVRTLDSASLSILLVNGAIAFGLNVASFEANKRSGALTMTIAANIKQVLTIVLSIALWHIPVGMMNAYGITLTLVGGAWYGRVELVGKTAKMGVNQLEEGVSKV
ncbi:MAG: hypothetical protein Q9213_006961 [Squamulea squamosa]